MGNLFALGYDLNFPGPFCNTYAIMLTLLQHKEILNC